MKIYTQNQIVRAEAENIEDVRVLLDLGRWPKVEGEVVVEVKKKRKFKRGSHKLPDVNQTDMVRQKLLQTGFVDTDWYKEQKFTTPLNSIIWSLKNQGTNRLVFDQAMEGNVAGTENYRYFLK